MLWKLTLDLSYCINHSCGGLYLLLWHGVGLPLKASDGSAIWSSVISGVTVHLRGVIYADSTTAVPIISEVRLDYLSNSLYSLPSVTEKEAQRLLDYLVQGRFLLRAADIDLQLRKEAGSYELRMTLKEGIDPEMLI